MYATDYHTHTQLSPDSTALLCAMAQAAQAAQLDAFCVTDHYDLLTETGARSPAYDWAPALAQRAEAARGSAVQIQLGIELGSATVDVAAAQAVLAQPALDFAIGSIHNFSPAAGGTDLYFADYSTPEGCYAALDDYFASMAELAAQPALYDVLGHIIYPLRYMPRPVPLDRYWERIDAILQVVIAQGRGIELNTYRGQTLEDWRPLFARYRARGGEIITVGSDAHAPEQMGAGIRDAHALLADLGFRYICGYEKRRPEFKKLT